jgi:glycosyltransferase involved in cell wall biosynthesis
MRVGFVSHSAEVGGAELSLYEAAKGLLAYGHDPHVVLPSGGPLADRLEHAGIDVSVLRYPLWVSSGRWHAPQRRLLRLVGSAVASRGLADRFRALRPDLVVTNTLAVSASALAARRLGLPHVWYIHEFGEEDHGLAFDLPRSLSRCLIDRLSTRVLVNSSAVRRSVEKWAPPERIRLVYYAVDVPDPRVDVYRPHGGIRLVVLGRMAPGKRQDEAIRALGLLTGRGMDASLTLVGGAAPGYRRHLALLARDLGVETRVRFVPFTEGRLSYLAAADVALVCSRIEAFGRVTVEAMKVGTPVVGADSGGTSELIRDGWNGLLYRPGDPEDLASKVASLGRDRALLLQMSRRAQQWSRSRFNTEAHIRGLLSVFEEAVSDRLRQ